VKNRASAYIYIYIYIYVVPVTVVKTKLCSLNFVLNFVSKRIKYGRLNFHGSIKVVVLVWQQKNF
jgi:hypothetical protein